MSQDPNFIEVQETINEARACLRGAVRIDPGRVALEGVIEGAYERLDDAREALKLDDVEWTLRALAEALDLLRTDQARLIAQDAHALADAIRLIESARGRVGGDR